MKLSDNTINKMLEAQNGNCYYCGTRLIKGYKGIGNIEIEHKKPHSIHKDGTRNNLCLSCVRCNRIKRTHEISEFKNLILNGNYNILINGLFYFETI